MNLGCLTKVRSAMSLAVNDYLSHSMLFGSEWLSPATLMAVEVGKAEVLFCHFFPSYLFLSFL